MVESNYFHNNIQQYLKMEFPQINKYQSVLERHLKPSYDILSAFSYDVEPIPKQNLEEILSNLDEINLARSYNYNRITEQDNTMESSKVLSNASSQQTLQFDLESRTCNSERKIKRNSNNRSLIFTPQNFNKHKQEKNRSQRVLKIYYFNLPTFKLVNYNFQTKINEVITEAISMYLEDQGLDHSKIESKLYQSYQLRLLLSEDSHKADMSISAIGYDRLVTDNIFESLVLLQKDNSKSFKSETINFMKTPKKLLKQTMIIIFNELGEQLGNLSMGRNDSLDKIFQYVEANDLHNLRSYFLTENQYGNDALPMDFQIKNLESNHIFIKSRRFIDQTDSDVKPQLPRKFTSAINVIKSKQTTLNLPIGLNQASQYEQFTVIKVNNMGFQQERVIGIDQTKIYNYDKMVRQEKKSTSFLSKIFGTNESTGTKRPFRLINDILQLKKIENGLIITFKDKAIKYYVKNVGDRQNIHRKLNFLLNYLRDERRNKQKLSRG